MRRLHVWRGETLRMSFRYKPEPSAFEVEMAIEKLKKRPRSEASACKVEENCALLGYYETSSGYFLPFS